ncbi:FHA domain-containing protein [Clostridium sp. Cult3]|uniref:FHA domain-containing protein n=1 Tax=Clostridium sp. Cult3 TaxID=2079004 RepID=UPI001F2DAD59|nr:FHA domain-containing protein [Clostridium sp. Cult3]MCF6459793.1 FHA domain-containing protein [Clostridium sp. Cult3]
MYNIFSLIFKYIFIIIIYMFILSIIRLIYLDIKGIDTSSMDNSIYLKLINRKDSLPFKVKEYYPLDGQISLGRGNDNQIVLKDPYISKRHLIIVEDEGNFYLEDLNSSNGTYLNGDRIMDVVELKNGDTIRVGQVEFLYVNREQG